jgi:hypothetical protein
VCSLSGCCCDEIVRLGSDSTMMLGIRMSSRSTRLNSTHSKSSSLSDIDASFSKQNEYSPTWCQRSGHGMYRRRAQGRSHPPCSR